MRATILTAAAVCGALAISSHYTAAVAAPLAVTDATIDNGLLTVKGSTAGASDQVTLDGLFTAQAKKSKFTFTIGDYHPDECLVTVRVGGASAIGVVANCGTSGIFPRGTWSSATPYLANDLVTLQGSAYRALRDNTNKNPTSSAADWETFVAKGAAGAAGTAGSTGPAGPTGPQGPTGATGSAGATGATGPQGSQGPTGANGTGFTWRAAWSAATNYAINDAVQFGGKSYVALLAGPNKSPASEPTYWSLLVSGQNWRGTWSAATAYNTNDAIARNGSSYLALADTTNEVPEATPGSWSVLSLKGDTGSQGTQGPQGASGATGATGTQRPKGDTGNTGEAGAQGAQGLTGATGSQGPQGPQGATGATGSTGAQGPQGTPGTNGTNGADGTSFTWRSAWSAATAYTLHDAVSRNGSSYMAIQAGTNKDPETQTTFWTLMAQKGDQGTKGDTGNTGAQGAAGSQGSQGPQGPQGALGSQGAQGATGVQGPQGPAGPNTIADGTVSAPAIKFTSSSNTGIFSPAVNKIALAEQGFLFLHNLGTNNTGLGFAALSSVTSGLQNSALGSGAMFFNTTGIDNVAVGFQALGTNLAGASNTAVGKGALYFNTANSNTAVGDRALYNNATGAHNVGVGPGSLYSSTNSSQNTAIGSGSLQLNTTGINNAALGLNSLSSNTTGSHNVAVGTFAGWNSTAPTDSIFISNQGLSADTRTIKIGTQGTQSSAFFAGIRGITTGSNNAIPVLIDSNGQLGTVSSSRRYKYDIASMRDAPAMLQQLRPVTFRYKQAQDDGAHPLQYGLIAEEVADVFPDLAVFNDKGAPETVKYHLLPSFLLAGYQQQQKTIAALKDDARREKEAHAAQIASLEQRLRAIEAMLPRVTTTAAAQHGEATKATLR